MTFFRSPILRRIAYVIAFGLAVARFAAARSHSEPLIFDDPLPNAAIERPIR
jgi:hypothetical protein